MFKFRNLALSAALAALVGPSVAIGAQDNGKPVVARASPESLRAYPSITVSYADLNLSRSEGEARLNARVRRAARLVCGIENGVMPLQKNMAAVKCYKKALARASNDIRIAVTRLRPVHVVAASDPGALHGTAR